MRTWSCRLRRSQGRQPQRGCVPQPGVAPRHEGLPRESTPARRPNPEGVASLGRAGAIAPAPRAQARHNPVGVGWNPAPLSPGSGGYAATRGSGMEPRWGSQGVTRPAPARAGHANAEKKSGETFPTIPLSSPSLWDACGKKSPSIVPDSHLHRPIWLNLFRICVGRSAPCFPLPFDPRPSPRPASRAAGAGPRRAWAALP